MRAETWVLTLVSLTLACPGEETGGDGSTGASTTETPATGDVWDTEVTEPGPTTDTEPGTTTEGPADSSGTEGTDTDDPTTGGGVDCGNGITDPGEACDDGNAVNADGCNQDCTISGSVLWSHSQAGGIGASDQAFAVAVDTRGRAYVAGEFTGANLDFWVRQYEEDDSLGWTHVLDGGGGNDSARAAVISGSTLYVTGYRNVAGQSNNTWLRGFGLDGSFGLDTSYNGVINGSDLGQGIAVDPGGNLIVAGYEAINLQGSNIWIREYSPAGAALWTVGYGGVANSNDQARAVATDLMGNVAVTGFETVTGQGRDLWVRYYDTNGSAIWTANYGNLNALGDEGRGVAFDAAGNVIVAGFENDPVIPWRIFLRKYDALGVELWSQPWDGELGQGANALASAVDSAGDIVVVGQHRSGDFNQILVRKYDTDGNVRWTTTIDGAPDTNQVGLAVAIGPGDRIWIAGGIDLGVDGRDIYVARLAP